MPSSFSKFITAHRFTPGEHDIHDAVLASAGRMQLAVLLLVLAASSTSAVNPQRVRSPGSSSLQMPVLCT